MERDRNPLVNSTCGQGVITLHIVATADDEMTALEMAAKDEALLRSKLGDLVFGSDDQSLAEVIGIKLHQSGRTVSVAESCTGGLVAKLLTDVAGSSDYFTYGWVTYSNEAKTSELGVDPELIENNGAVSEEVATAMSQGARQRSGSDFAIGITGIAGPDGGSDSKQVGLVYISIDSQQGSEVWKRNFSGVRGTIRRRAAQTALNLLRLKVQD
jgi:nicotinamide-nucleotide amidase